MGCVKHTTFRKHGIVLFHIMLQPCMATCLYLLCSLEVKFSRNGALLSSTKFKVHHGIVPVRMCDCIMTSSWIWGESHHIISHDDPVLARAPGSCTSVQISTMESDHYEDSVGVPVPSRERDFVKNVSIWRQFRALVRRTDLYERESTTYTLCVCTCRSAINLDIP